MTSTSVVRHRAGGLEGRIGIAARCFTVRHRAGGLKDLGVHYNNVDSR